MTFRLTFNKPAVRQFIEGGEENTNLRIKIENDSVMFMPSIASEHDSVSLVPRTRGGYEALVEGDQSDEVLNRLNNPHGPFFILRRHSKDWVVAEPFSGQGAPPKFEPHVRIWSDNAPKVSTKTKVRTNEPAHVKASPVVFENPVDRIRWAYGKLEEQRRPGRPSNEFHQARSIVIAFEKEALNFVANTSQPKFNPENLKSVIEAYNALGEFLQTICPQAVQDHIESHKIPRRRRRTNGPSHETQAVQSHIQSDDEIAADQVRDASAKLGLDEASPTISRKVRGTVNTRAFGGESLIE